MTRPEPPHLAVRARWGRRALTGAVVVPILALSAACGSSTPDAAGTTSPVAPGSTAGSTPGTAPSTSGPGFDDATQASFQKVLDDTRATGGFPGVIALVSGPEGSWIG